MKQGLSLFLFFFGSFILSQAQSTNCGFTPTEGQLRHFLNVKKEAKYNLDRNSETTYIPIKFHAVATADGEGRVRFENILEQLCALNENFENLDFKFYLKDGEVNNIDNNTIYNNPSSAAGTSKMVSEKTANGKNAVNIFITDAAGTGTSGQGTTLGYYDFNQDLVVLKKSVLSNRDQLSFVLGHEMGHFFSLPHTFNGWDSSPWDGTPVTSTTSPGGELNELADSSNCEIAGDMICDTPADYNLGFGWDGCRAYDGGCTDPTGALLDPDESNFMGYFIGCDKYFFSDEQSAIMVADYSSSRRSYLRVSFIPDEATVESVAGILSPADDSTTPFFNGVHVEWEVANNASHYLLELTQGLFKFYYITEVPALFLTDLQADKNYRWRVKAFSALSTCADYSGNFNFKTGDQTSSIKDNVLLEKNISIFPNPSDGSALNLEFRGYEGGNVKVELSDISGNLVLSENFNSGQIRLQNLNLETGFYLISIKNKNNNVTKKVVVDK